MWKDFFFFSGSQRAGIVVLTVLIIFAVVISVGLPAFLPQHDVINYDTAFLEEIERFQASLVQADSAQKENRQRFNRYYTQYPDRRKQDGKTENIQRFPFDPNTLDSVGLTELGIPRYIVSNILRYRSKGGYFSTPEKFAAIYGMRPELFADLQPFIVIENNYLKEVDLEASSTLAFPVDLNMADSTQLLQLKGLSRGMVRSVLRFRTASGGFVDPGQLKEVYGMTDELYNRIRPLCTANPAAIRKIMVNQASVDKLRAHPYLNFYQAKAIYELRRRKGKLESIDQLRHLDELDEATLNKLTAYFSFE